MREHRIKAFRAVTIGNYGGVGWVGAGRIGGKRWGRGRKKPQIEAFSVVILDKFYCKLGGTVLAKEVLTLRKKLQNFSFHFFFSA